MFGVPKERLIEGLEKHRLKICCYMGPMCDCKYGANDIKYSGEQTGCPEIRMAIKLIDGMSDRQFRKICKKQGIIT